MEYILVRAPQLATSPRLVALIALAESKTGDFGDDRNEAVALLSLHWLVKHDTITTGGGAISGPISSETEGDLARSYASGSTVISDGDLSTTSWGIELYTLRQMQVFPMTRMS